MEWTTYALVACGSLAFICLVMGGIEHFVWKEWDRSQRAAHLSSLEEEVRQLRQECKVAYHRGWDDGFAQGAAGYGSDNVIIDDDPTPAYGMDRFPTDLI